MSKAKDYVLYSVNKIERYKHDEKMIVDIIQKLNKVAVTAELLQETGAYSLMKDLSLKGGKVGERAQPVYNKWKLLISIAMKNRISPIRTPEQTSYDKPPSNKSSSFSKSSAESYRSRDSDSGRSSKYPEQTRKDNFAPECDSNRPDFELNNQSRDSDSGRSSKYSEHSSKYSEHSSKYSEHSSKYSEHSSKYSEHTQKHQSAPNSADSTRPDQNGVNADNDVDGAFNPHLSIEHSEKSFSADDGSDHNATTKSSRIREPYHIEMREGMFRAVRNDSIDKSVLTNGLRACEFIERELIQQKQQSCKSDREKQPKQKNSEAPNPSRPVTPSKERVTVTDSTNRDKRRIAFKNYESKSKTATPELPARPWGGDSNVQSNSEARTKYSLPVRPTRDIQDFQSKGKRRLSPNSMDLPDEGSKSDESGRKRDDKRLRPEPVSDHELKLKSIEKERSPGHLSKMTHKSETQPTYCDKRTPKKIDSPEGSAIKLFSSKKERKAIYSGKKSLQEVLSLQQSCVRVLRKNLDYLKCIRKVPYKALKPVLDLLNPMQLHKIEEQNQHLLKYTDELWKQHCNRDYRCQNPGKSETWRETYYKAHKEQSRKLKNLTASISAAASKAKPDRQAKLTLVDTVHDPHRKRLKTSNGPAVTPTTNSSIVVIKSSPNASAKISAPIVKTGSPHSTKPKEIKSVLKPVKKVDAPLMSKVKKSIGLLYRPK